MTPPPLTSPQLNPSPAPACSRLSHYPSDTVDASLGAFGTRSPLAKPGPSLVLFRAIWGQRARAIWPTRAAFADDLLGGVCVCLIPPALMFLEFLQ